MQKMIDIKVVSWSDSWFSMSLSERKELLENHQDWRVNKYTLVTSKRYILCNILTDAYKAKKMDVIEDIYNSILKLGYLNEYSLNHYEYSLLWIEAEMKEGLLIDEYDIQMALGHYYEWEKKDYSKAIDYYKKACLNIPLYQEDAQKREPRPYLDYYTKAGYLLVLALIMNKQFDESRNWEKYIIEKGYFAKDDKHISSIHYNRLTEEIGALSKEGKVLTNLDDIKAFEEANMPEHAAFYYKSVAYQYYKQGDYNRAKELYEKAYENNPNLAGVESKLKAVKKKLGED